MFEYFDADAVDEDVPETQFWTKRRNLRYGRKSFLPRASRFRGSVRIVLRKLSVRRALSLSSFRRAGFSH